VIVNSDVLYKTTLGNYYGNAISLVDRKDPSKGGKVEEDHLGRTVTGYISSNGRKGGGKRDTIIEIGYKSLKRRSLKGT